MISERWIPRAKRTGTKAAVRFLSLILFTEVLTCCVQAQILPIQEIILENGLKVLLLEDHKSPAVTFQVWYRVGSRNERDGKSGLAHFLEHMVGPKDYSRIIAKNGGESNAFTTTDVTVYFATMSRASIDTAIDMEAARMANVMLDGAQFEPEKKVIMEERRLGTEDSPVSALAELTSAITYTNHPYRRPVIGWMKDIENLTLEDLEIHYRTYYVPNNAFLVVVGDFSIPEMLTKIRSSFGKIPRGPDPPRSISEDPPQRGEKRVIFKREAELPFLLIYYRTPNMNDPDSIALDVLTTILAGGRSARLYKELVYDKRLAPSVDVSYYGLSIDPTVLSITAQIMPGKSPDQVERVVDAVLDRIKSEPVSDQELEKAKNQIAAAFVFNQDGVYGQAITIGYFESAAHWRLINGYLDGVKKVSAADILRVSRKYLDNDQRTVGTLIPSGGKK